MSHFNEEFNPQLKPSNRKRKCLEFAENSLEFAENAVHLGQCSAASSQEHATNNRLFPPYAIAKIIMMCLPGSGKLSADVQPFVQKRLGLVGFSSQLLI